MTLTRGHLLRHFQGKKGGFHPAMLDVAQDHLLAHLHEQGLFDIGLVFKGGTSLRKMRSGAAGRFSTDLDFCAPADGLAGLVLDAADGATVGPFAFTLVDRDDAAGRADLTITAPFGPGPADTAPAPIGILSKLELSPRAPWLAPQVLPFLPLAVHTSYDVPALPALPVVRAEEAIAEKLARYARVPLARDLYDLVWYGRQGVLDEASIRRLWLLKVYNDVVIDGRWNNRAFNPAAIMTARQAADIDEESIGYLTQPVDIPGWEAEFRRRYAFLADLDHDDRDWSKCHAGRRYEYGQLIASYGNDSSR
jgi:predicted nucleotidyltransferase component of viral defense system